MVILRTKEIKEMSKKDLDRKLNELKLELAKEKANINIGASVTSPGRIKEIKRTIARIETIKRERLAEKQVLEVSKANG